MDDLVERLIDEADGYGDGPVVVHDIELLRALLREAAAALRLAVPDGFVVVPREPTESMVEAICAAHAAGGWPDGYGKHAQGLHRAHAQIGYRAMLAVAPKPEDS